MDVITAFISQIKNPFQYICVGVAWIIIEYYNLEKYLGAAIMVAIGLAAIVQWIIKVLLKYIKYKIAAKYVLESLHNLSPQEQELLFEAYVTNYSDTTHIGYERLAVARGMQNKGILKIPAGEYFVNTTEGIPVIITRTAMKLLEKHHDDFFGSEC